MIYCPTSPVDIISKYYAKDSDIYYILWIHSEQVKDKAIEIATKHPELKADLRFLEAGWIAHLAPQIRIHPRLPVVEHRAAGCGCLRRLLRLE